MLQDSIITHPDAPRSPESRNQSLARGIRLQRLVNAEPPKRGGHSPN